MRDSPKTPCNPAPGRQDAPGRVATATAVVERGRLRPDEVREMRQWLVRVVARRAVAILKEQEQGE
jgi:hypothetical protein